VTITDSPADLRAAGLEQFRLHEPAQKRTAVVTPMLARVLQSLLEGKTNSKIGADWGIEIDTVKTHMRRLFTVLGARDRVHAVILVRSGEVCVWIKPESGRWGSSEQHASSFDAATLGSAAPYPPPL